MQNPDTDDALAASRPRWHWILIGAGFVITLFLPLSQLGVRIGLGALPVAISFLLACGLAGALVGRFGGRAKAREAALSGALGAFVAWGIAALGGALRPWPVALISLIVLVGAGAGAAWVGARFGVGARPR